MTLMPPHFRHYATPLPYCAIIDCHLRWYCHRDEYYACHSYAIGCCHCHYIITPLAIISAITPFIPPLRHIFISYIDAFAITLQVILLLHYFHCIISPMRHYCYYHIFITFFIVTYLRWYYIAIFSLLSLHSLLHITIIMILLHIISLILIYYYIIRHITSPPLTLPLRRFRH